MTSTTGNGLNECLRKGAKMIGTTLRMMRQRVARDDQDDNEKTRGKTVNKKSYTDEATDVR